MAAYAEKHHLAFRWAGIACGASSKRRPNIFRSVACTPVHKSTKGGILFNAMIWCSDWMPRLYDYPVAYTAILSRGTPVSVEKRERVLSRVAVFRWLATDALRVFREI